jgi:hypothetical protein
MPKHISNGCKIDQIVIKYTKIFHSKTLQKLPKLGFFWFENKPSGNPGAHHRCPARFVFFCFFSEEQEQAFALWLSEQSLKNCTCKIAL